VCGEREPLIPIKFVGATDDGLEQIERGPVIASAAVALMGFSACRTPNRPGPNHLLAAFLRSLAVAEWAWFIGPKIRSCTVLSR
jgi:hypothetical protein